MNTIQSLFFESGRPTQQETFINQRAPINGLREGRHDPFNLQVNGNHVYVECGTGRPIIFCPGLYGSVHNAWKLGKALSSQYRFIVPCLPLYDVPLCQCAVSQLADYLQSFVDDLRLRETVFMGSSMGGGASLYYALKKQHLIQGLVLCGSSGLSTIPMQKGFFKRKHFSFVKQAIQDVFFDPSTPSDQMISEVFEALQKYEIVLRSIRFTKSTARDHLDRDLGRINIPTLLIWGMQDRITPPNIGKLFADKLPNSELHFIDRCGHVPTQEHPEEVFGMVKNFLRRIQYA